MSLFTSSDERERKMKILLLLAALSTVCLAGDYEVDEGVLVLTKDTFSAAVEEHAFLLVEFCKLITFLFVCSERLLLHALLIPYQQGCMHAVFTGATTWFRVPELSL